MGKRRPARKKETRTWDVLATSDERWFDSLGFQRPHTRIGVAAAQRLIARGFQVELLRTYVNSAPKTMPFSEDDPDTTARKPLRLPTAKPKGPKVYYREVSGGAPTLGKRR